MMQQITLRARSRGFHLITDEIVDQLDFQDSSGLLHLFLQHSSASLTINENADPYVRHDMERYFLHTVPDQTDFFEHTCEGPDDMPAHVKSTLIGASLLLPVRSGQLMLGTWQGIWLGEHREHGGARKVMASLIALQQ